MSDPFEDLLKKRMAELPEEEPKLGHFDRFRDQLDQPTTKKRQRWWWAAAELLPLLGSLALYTEVNPEVVNITLVDTTEQVMPAELAEAELFFENTLAAQRKLVDHYGVEDGHPLAGYLSHLDTLELHYEALRMDLKEHGWNNRIEASMIQNYRLRISILQSMLEELENHSKNKPHDNHKIQST